MQHVGVDLIDMHDDRKRLVYEADCRAVMTNEKQEEIRDLEITLKHANICCQTLILQSHMTD